MNLLFGRKVLKIEQFAFEINRWGEFNIQEEGLVTITFINEKFDNVQLPFSGKYNRNVW